MRLASPLDFYFLVIMCIVRGASWVPYRWVRKALAEALAELSYRLSRAKRRQMTRALGAAFKGRLDPSETRRILKGSFLNLWLEVLGWKPCRMDARAVAKARIVGWEHLEQAMSSGKGVILWEHGGFGHRLLAKQILASKGIRIHQIRGADHLGCLETYMSDTTWLRAKVIRPFFDGAEMPFYAGFTCLTMDGDLSYAREFLSVLGRNGVLAIAADGQYGARRLSIPFLGAEQPFSTGMVSLARQSGASIIPVLCNTTDDGRLCLNIEKAMQPSRDKDRDSEIERILTAYAALMESYVVRSPDKYRNWHLLATKGQQ